MGLTKTTTDCFIDDVNTLAEIVEPLVLVPTAWKCLLGHCVAVSTSFIILEGPFKGGSHGFRLLGPPLFRSKLRPQVPRLAQFGSKTSRVFLRCTNQGWSPSTCRFAVCELASRSRRSPGVLVLPSLPRAHLARCGHALRRQHAAPSEAREEGVGRQGTAVKQRSR